MNTLFYIKYKFGCKRIFSIFLLVLTVLFSGNFQRVIASAEKVQAENKQTRNSKVGKFILQYKPSASNQEIRDLLIKSKVFDATIAHLNDSSLVMREDIHVTFEDCGQPNAFWNSSKATIIVCYENTAADLALFYEVSKYPIEQAVKKSIHETVFAFYHELGHAFIDVLPLSSIGQEEDTVDEFATVMLFSTYPHDLAAEMILDSAEYYELLYKITGRNPGWDEHAPHDKRLFNLVCLVYGSNPQQYEQVFRDKFVLVDPEKKATQDNLNRRAALCQQEFPKKIASWNRLLLPHYASQNGNQRTPGQKPPGHSPGVSRRGNYW